MQFSVAVGNARLAAIEAAIGTSAIVKIRTGAQPADCATADSGTVLATLNLPSDWMGDPVARTVAMTGTWQDLSADATGIAAHFRIYDSGGSVCGAQGDITIIGGGGDMVIASVDFTAGQEVRIVSFVIADGNA